MSRIHPKPGRHVRFTCWTISNTTYEGEHPGKIPPIAERTGVVVEHRRFGQYLVRRDADGGLQACWPSQLLEYVEEAEAVRVSPPQPQRSALNIEDWTSRMAQCSLPCIVVYDHPKDFPDAFVARLFDGEQPTQVHAQADSLDGLHVQLPLQGLARIPRYAQDDPVILEAWI